MIMALCVIMFSACRQHSDEVLNYTYNDRMAFGEADRSYAAKFEVMWRGMNANYALWDFEYANGLDWDKVYDKYYPKFKALDEQQGGVTDEQLQVLLNEVVAPLHDGHLMIQMKNHQTGSFIMASPGHLRVQRERGYEYATVAGKKPILDYYQANGKLKEYKTSSSTNFIAAFPAMFTWLGNAINALQAKGDAITPDEAALLEEYMKAWQDLSKILEEGRRGVTISLIEAYNIVAYRYEYLHIPGLTPFNTKLEDMPLTVTYALFEGNIAYLGFTKFSLLPFVNPEATPLFFPDADSAALAIIQDIRDTWNAWFDAIQKHHAAGDLGGVIIDVRSNTGGMLNDFPLVIGALVPAGGMHESNARFKRGTGRLDYSPIMPQTMATLSDEHVTVTEPIAVLCNCATVSMGEHTSYSAKLLDNARLIGTRTHGGFCALSGKENYTNNYAGYVGEQNVTSVFCYIPQEVALTLDNEILEGYGVTPDIEIPFDAASWNYGAGPDNQIERALQFIRMGN